MNSGWPRRGQSALQKVVTMISQAGQRSRAQEPHHVMTCEDEERLEKREVMCDETRKSWTRAMEPLRGGLGETAVSWDQISSHQTRPQPESSGLFTRLWLWSIFGSKHPQFGKCVNFFYAQSSNVNQPDEKQIRGQYLDANAPSATIWWGPRPCDTRMFLHTRIRPPSPSGIFNTCRISPGTCWMEGGNLLTDGCCCRARVMQIEMPVVLLWSPGLCDGILFQQDSADEVAAF